MGNALDIFEETSSTNGSSKSKTPSKVKVVPLDAKQRIILETIFDTQPTKKALYLKKLGWEVDPEDNNKVKPIGSDTPFVEIDPGFKAYFKKGGPAELGKDLQEMALSLTMKGPAVSIGGAVGAIGGGLAGAGLGALAAAPTGEALAPVTVPAGMVKGAAIGGGLGLAAGGALGSKFVEFVKDKEAKSLLGDMLIDKDTNPDAAFQNTVAVIDGVAPFLGKAIAVGGKALTAAAKRAAFDTMKKMAARLGNGMTPQIVEKIAANPAAWTPKSVEGANTNLTKLYKDLLGLAEGETRAPDLSNLPKDSLMGKAFQPLLDRQKTAIQSLSNNPNSSFTAKELIEPLQTKFNQLHDELLRNGTLDNEAQAAYLKLKSEIFRIKEAATTVLTKNAPTAAAGAAAKGALPIPSTLLDSQGLPLTSMVPKKEITQQQLMDVKLPFETGYTIIKDMQKAVFQDNVPGSTILKQVIGGGEDQLNNVVRKKALQSGVDWENQIQKPIKEFVENYDIVRKSVTPTNLTTALLSDVKSPQKQLVSEGFILVDKMTNSNFSQSVKDGSMKAAVERMYSAPGKAAGSAPLNSVIASEVASGRMKGAVKGGVAGAATGAAVGQQMGAPGLGAAIGTVGGAIVGGVKGGAEAATQAGSLYDVNTMIAELAKAKAARDEAAKQFTQFSFAPKAAKDLIAPAMSTLASPSVAGQINRTIPGSLNTPQPVQSQQQPPPPKAPLAPGSLDIFEDDNK